MEIPVCSFRAESSGRFLCSCRDRFPGILSDTKLSVNVVPGICLSCRIPFGGLPMASGSKPVLVNYASVPEVPPTTSPPPALPLPSDPLDIQLLQSSWEGVRVLVSQFGSASDKDACDRVERASSSCGCRHKMPGIKADLWRRFAVKREGQKFAGNVLLVGNSGRFSGIGVDINDFQDVVLFNDSRHKNLLHKATFISCRHCSAEYVYPGLEQDIVAPDNCVFILMDGAHRAKSVTSKLKHKFLLLGARKDMVNGFVDYEVPGGKWPSTGFATLCWFLRRGCSVTITGFTWEGWVNHGWDHERAKCIQWEREGKLTIVYREYCL